MSEVKVEKVEKTEKIEKIEKAEKKEKKTDSFKEILKKYGAGIIKTGASLVEKKYEVVSFSPALDCPLGGGIREGTTTLISGKYKSGKTTSILSLASNVQKLGRTIWYLDAEARLKAMNLKGIAGLNPDKFNVIASEEGKILSGEEFGDIAIALIHENPGDMIVIDSTSALCPEKELTGELKTNGRSENPKLLGAFCRKISNVVAVNRTFLILVQHQIANTSGYGSPIMEDGGNKIQYQADNKLRIKSAQPWTTGTNDNQKTIGLKVNWQVLTSALENHELGGEANSFIRFGIGIDRVSETIAQGISYGFIEQAGAWFSYKEEKSQGQERLYTFFKDNPEKLITLEKEIRELMT